VSRVLVLSAWEPEIRSLREKVRGSKLETSVKCRTVGVGAVDAAINAARAIADEHPLLAIFVGTAGAYPPLRARAGGAASAASAIGGVVVADKLALVATEVLRGDGYLPEPMVVTTATAGNLAHEILSYARVPGPAAATVACPLAITRSRVLGRSIARATHAAVENLEAFSAARAATAAGVPFAAVLGVANQVGPRAHAEWLANHRAASKAACDVVWTWLRR